MINAIEAWFSDGVKSWLRVIARLDPAYLDNDGNLPVVFGTSNEAFRWDVDSTPNIVYLGYALPAADPSDPVWKIQIFDLSGKVSKLADGNGDYDNVWDNRTGLTYE